MGRRQPRFDAVLVEAVHEGLNSISPSVSTIVFFYLKKSASVRFDESVVEPEALEEGLEKIFGVGAKVIEKKILEVLYVKLEVPLKIEDDFEFAEEVRNVQKLLESDELELLDQQPDV